MASPQSYKGRPDEWKPLDIAKHFRALAFLTGKRFAPEAPGLSRLVFDGLAMPRPHLIGDNAPPWLEANPKPAVTDLKQQQQKILEAITKEKHQDGDRRDPFTDEPTARAWQEFAGKNRAIPEHSLMRFFDFIVEPGRTYEYRIQIRMMNPYYQRKDVIESLAKQPEIVSEWKTIPQRVVVPPDVNFYVVKRLPGAGKDQAVFQAHRWMDYASPNPKTLLTFAVGRWVVGEPILVNRGEFLRGEWRIEVPLWQYTQSKFVLATAEKPPQNRIPVQFGADAGGPILVDFGGGKMTHKKGPRLFNGNAAHSDVVDEAPVEVLLLSPDGRLLARNSLADADDPERVRRESSYRQIVDAIKKAGGQ